jgi:tetratricopeptide (TPR) repeat protein
MEKMAMHDRRSPQPISLRIFTGVVHRLGAYASVTLTGVSLLVLGLGTLGPTLSPAQTLTTSPPVPHTSLLDAGHEAFRRGAFEQASEIWAQAAQSAHDAGRLEDECDARLGIGRALLSLGFHTRAVSQLDLAVALAREAQDRSRQAAAMEWLGQAYLAGGQPEAALDTLESARQVAVDLGDQIRLASIVHSLGAVQSALKQNKDALASYREARRLAESVHADALVAAATINGAKLALRMAQWQMAQTLFEEGLSQVARLT